MDRPAEYYQPLLINMRAEEFERFFGCDKKSKFASVKFDLHDSTTLFEDAHLQLLLQSLGYLFPEVVGESFCHGNKNVPVQCFRSVVQS